MLAGTLAKVSHTESTSQQTTSLVCELFEAEYLLARFFNSGSHVAQAIASAYSMQDLCPKEVE